jgi:hypothetical protein
MPTTNKDTEKHNRLTIPDKSAETNDDCVNELEHGRKAAHEKKQGISISIFLI